MSKILDTLVNRLKDIENTMGFSSLFIFYFTSLLPCILVALVCLIYLFHTLRIRIREVKDGTSRSNK